MLAPKVILSKNFPRFRFAGDGGGFLCGEKTNMDVPSIAIDGRFPFFGAAGKRYSFNTAHIVRPSSTIREILRSIAKSQIATTIIQSVMVDVVYVRTWISHYYAVHKSLVVSGVETWNCSVQRPRTVRNKVEVAGACFCEHSLGERNEKIILNGNRFPLFFTSRTWHGAGARMAAVFSALNGSLKRFFTGWADAIVHFHTTHNSICRQLRFT